MTALDLVFDVVLATVMPVLVWRILASKDLASSVVLFVALGLVSALAWARLHAPDIALVEAAVGAGLTGALLMNALSWIGAEAGVTEPVSRATRVGVGILVTAVGVGLAVAVIHLTQPVGLAHEVNARLADAHVDYPVTAVLLSFRGYDTLLEIAVLVTAALGARLYAPGSVPGGDDPLSPHPRVLARVLTPIVVLVAGYLLWRGASAPGGAFQAAAVLAGGGILLVLARVLRPPRMSSIAVRAALVAGLAWFIAVAALPLATGAQLLEYPSASAKQLIISIEVALTLSISIVLLMFFPGEPAPGEAARHPEDRW